jgi:hypothetical protein
VLYLSGEGELTPRRVASGECARLAEALATSCVALEHRFYGASQPTNYSFSEPDELLLLSAEQALADAAAFAAWFGGAVGRRWVVVGGSLVLGAFFFFFFFFFF